MELAQLEDLLVTALVKGGKGGTAQALARAEHARQVKEAALGPDHVETASSLHSLGLVRLSRGEFNEALALHTRALEMRRAARADEGRLADSLDLVALSLIRLKRFDEAGQTLTEASRIREAREREAPLALAQTLELIALMHRRSGRFADAVQPAERSLALRRQHAPGHPDTAAPLQILGDLRFLAGDTAGAQRIWSEAREIAERGLGADHVAVAELLNRLGMAEALPAISHGHAPFESRRCGLASGGWRPAIRNRQSLSAISHLFPGRRAVRGSAPPLSQSLSHARRLCQGHRRLTRPRLPGDHGLERGLRGDDDGRLGGR